MGGLAIRPMGHWFQERAVRGLQVQKTSSPCPHGFEGRLDERFVTKSGVEFLGGCFRRFDSKSEFTWYVLNSKCKLMCEGHSEVRTSQNMRKSIFLCS